MVLGAGPFGHSEADRGALHSEIARVVNLSDVKDRFTGLGFETVGNTPDQFDAFIRSEITKWGKVVREAKIYAD